MKKVDLYPKCINCGEKATRWDGGYCGVVIRHGRLESGYIVWLCEKHDPDHKHFDLPSNFPEAIWEIAHLREELQKMHARYMEAEEKFEPPIPREQFNEFLSKLANLSGMSGKTLKGVAEDAIDLMRLSRKEGRKFSPVTALQSRTGVNRYKAKKIINLVKSLPGV